MQTAIITKGDAFGFAPTTHQATTAESYIAALRNIRVLRRQIRDAKRRRDEQTLGEIARGLAGAERCESDSELVGRMQFIDALIEQTRPLDGFLEALDDVETRFLTALDDVVACSEEARCVGIERLDDWKRDVDLTGEDLKHDRDLQEKIAGMLRPRLPDRYDARDAYEDELRASGSRAGGTASAYSATGRPETAEQKTARPQLATERADTGVPLGDTAPTADRYATTGETHAASTLVGDAPPSRQRTETRAARSSGSESGQRPSRKT